MRLMQPYTLGVDVGGTKIQVGIVNRAHRVAASGQLPNDTRSKKRAVAGIVRAVEQFFDAKKIRAIGVGITGTVDSATGTVVGAPNLPRDWRNVPLARLLTKKFKKPVRVDNDANCIAVAEAVAGRGRGHRVVLALTLGTGIGSGLVINETIYHGRLNAVEFGHTTIAADLPRGRAGSPRCSCGRRGHFEALASGRAMQSLYRLRTGHAKSTFAITDEADAGKRPAQAVLQQMSRSLAIGLANAIQAYSPDIIVLGGGLTRVTRFIRPALRLLPAQLSLPALRQTKIVISTMGYDAGVLGAALLTER